MTSDRHTISRDDEIFAAIYSLHYKALKTLIEQLSKSPMTKREVEAFLTDILLDPDMVGEFMDRLPEFRLVSVGEDGLYYTEISDMVDLPLTTLERRFLRTVLNDPRATLFDVDMSGLEDVDPLYYPEDVVYFEKYDDGDDYSDPKFAEVFGTIEAAMTRRGVLDITFEGRDSTTYSVECIPEELKYSRLNDRFRLIATKRNRGAADNIPVDTFKVNLASIISCREVDRLRAGEAEPDRAFGDINKLVFDVKNIRNARWRVAAHFSGFKKTVMDLGNDTYQVSVEYDADDEAEMVTRVLSFGPAITVLEPQTVIDRIKAKLARQTEISNQF